jgi:hypothetical protein
MKDSSTPVFGNNFIHRYVSPDILFLIISTFSLTGSVLCIMTSTSWKLSDRLPFLFGKACYVFRSENALYGTGHMIGRMMIMKTALLLNTL